MMFPMPDQVSPVFNVPLDNQGKPPAPREYPGPDQEYIERNPRHTGVAGVGRDILGTLGDFLLTRLGLAPMYGPAQQRRRISEAMTGFDKDPMSAINRVTDLDPAMGMQLRDRHADNERLEASQTSTAEAREARIALAQQTQTNRNRGIAASYFGSLAGSETEEERARNYQRIRGQVLHAFGGTDRQLLTLLPEEYDPVAVDAFIDSAVPVGTQRRLTLTQLRDKANYELGQDRIEQSDTNNRRTTSQSDTNNRRNNQTSRENTRDRNEQSDRNNRRSTSQSDRNNRRTTQQSDTNNRRSVDARRRTPREGERRVINGRTYVWRNGRAVAQ